MSIFNFRRGRPGSASAKASNGPSTAAESVEAVRKRARQRLIGSALLVLAGVVGFPLLFETQPRPVPVDIAIEIPSRSAVKPGSPIAAVTRNDPVVPAEPEPEPSPEPATAVKTPAQPAVATTAPVVPAQASLAGKEEIVTRPSVPAKPDPKLEPRAEAKLEAKAPPKPEPKPEVKAPPKPKVDDGQRARALLEGNNPAATNTDKRLVVQVGAFSDEALAREARSKLEKAGLKTYTQVAETKDGKRIRVRVGPYASKAEADKAASKIKGLNLPASVLAL